MRARYRRPRICTRWLCEQGRSCSMTARARVSRTRRTPTNICRAPIEKVGKSEMHTVSRRRFLGALASLGPAALLAKADPLGMPIACQVYPVREALGKDFAGTLGELHAIGYRAIEMCSPKG